MSANDATSLIERVQSSYKKLSEAAATLNSASDELGESISALDAALKKLNLGVTAWVTIVGGNDDCSLYYWSRDVGYDKIGGKWGIAISTSTGYLDRPDEESCDSWLFSDAPRAYRIEAIDKIPDLIEKLIDEASSVTNRIIEKTAEAKQLAEAIAPSPQPRRNRVATN